MKRMFVVMMGCASVAALSLGGAEADSPHYLSQAPEGAKIPPRETWAAEGLKAPLPTNDWWSSLLWLPFSEPMFPHPLALRCEAAGLRLALPKVSAGGKAIFGSFPGEGDLTIGLDGGEAFPEVKVESWSDWFVTAKFENADRVLRTSFGHGSPFVYATFSGGRAQIRFAEAPKIWSQGDEGVMGVTVGDRHYGIFPPTGSTWEGKEELLWTLDGQGKTYLSVAALPDDAPSTLALFRRFAHSHVIGTKVDWKYGAPEPEVETVFAFVTRAMEGEETGTLFALYPHQWKHLVKDAPEPERLSMVYPSVRGPMKLAEGTGFVTRMDFPGILPALPPSGDPAVLRDLLEQAAGQPLPPPKDTYWEGKELGRLACLLPLARALGSPAAKDLQAELQTRLEEWLTAKPGKTATLFYYDEAWGTLIGYPASYGSETDLSDHHFHYGYFLQAAAQLTLADPAWAAKWKPAVDLLVRDIAAGRGDERFPFLRNFDPYAGHSWASGTAKFGDGNNQESSSEALNAWAGLVLWGEATGDRELRDRGIFLFTTELAAVENYWFDVDGENFPPDFADSYLTLIWGGKAANETWFSAEPEAIHGINWLPMTGASLYLGRYPKYAADRYATLVQQREGGEWKQWADIIVMFRALSDAPGALAEYEGKAEAFPLEGGNSRANLYNWLHALEAYGTVDRTITADYPLFAVLKKDGIITRIIFNGGSTPRTVTFSDGTRLRCDKSGFFISR